MNAPWKLQQHGVTTIDSLSHRITRIIIESAALYSVNHLLYAALYKVKSNVETVPSFLVSLVLRLFACFWRWSTFQQEASIASITCSLIIVRSQKAIDRPWNLTSCIRVDVQNESVASEETSAKGEYRNNGVVFALQSMEDTSGAADSKLWGMKAEGRSSWPAVSCILSCICSGKYRLESSWKDTEGSTDRQ